MSHLKGDDDAAPAHLWGSLAFFEKHHQHPNPFLMLLGLALILGVPLYLCLLHPLFQEAVR
ncbi:MAG: hypothetical protein PVG14_11305 [Anaerolineales bacterium]